MEATRFPPLRSPVRAPCSRPLLAPPPRAPCSRPLLAPPPRAAAVGQLRAGKVGQGKQRCLEPQLINSFLPSFLRQSAVRIQCVIFSAIDRRFQV